MKDNMLDTIHVAPQGTDPGIFGWRQWIYDKVNNPAPIIEQKIQTAELKLKMAEPHYSKIPANNDIINPFYDRIPGLETTLNFFKDAGMVEIALVCVGFVIITPFIFKAKTLFVEKMKKDMKFTVLVAGIGIFLMGVVAIA